MSVSGLHPRGAVQLVDIAAAFIRLCLQCKERTVETGCLSSGNELGLGELATMTAAACGHATATMLGVATCRLPQPSQQN